VGHPWAALEAQNDGGSRRDQENFGLMLRCAAVEITSLLVRIVQTLRCDVQSIDVS
jgi:hypothetical protein